MSQAAARRTFVVTVAAVAAAWAGAALAQALPRATPESVGLSSERLGRLTAAMQQEIDARRLPGAVVMVARRGRLVYSQAFGSLNAAGAGAMKEDSIFRIYSMTKPLVSVALMTLVEEGRVQLTDQVSKFLPSFKSPMVSVAAMDPVSGAVTHRLVAAGREPTVYDLLRHTSGLAYGEITRNAPVREAYVKAGVYRPELDYDARGVPGPQQAEALGRAPLAQQPGTTWEYSLSVDVQGRVIEAVTGRRLGEFLQERLFTPLKMVDTGFVVPADRLARLAEPFTKDPATGVDNRVIDVGRAPANDSGGAGGVSTAGDYLRFCQAMLSGGQLDGQRILSRTTVRMMTSDQLAGINTAMNPGMLLLGSPGYTFGLGFLVRPADGNAAVQGSAGEFMWAGYGGTFFWAEPKEQLCAVYMTQAPSPLRAGYRRLVKELVSQAIAD